MQNTHFYLDKIKVEYSFNVISHVLVIIVVYTN
jgi:hypothetical protein